MLGPRFRGMACVIGRSGDRAMDQRREQRWLGIGGLVFVAILLVAVFTTPNKDSHLSAADAVKFFQDHKTAVQVSAWFTALAIVVGIFFFWFLRRHLATGESRWGLENVGFVGGVIFGVGGGIAAGLKLALADGVGHVDPIVIQSLNVLFNNLAMIVTGTGVALFLIGNGITVTRSSTLPHWLGWAGVVIGVLSIVGPGAPLAGLWILVASVLLIVRARSTAAAA